MRISRGLFDNVVLQRNRADRCDAELEGRCTGSGALQAKVRLNGQTVRGFGRVNIGRAVRGKFTGRLKGLKTGGPYEIELKIVGHKGAVLDQLLIINVLVGDVWILAGQSNMEGIGSLVPGLKRNVMVRAFYMDDRWDDAEDPIHNLEQALDRVHSELGWAGRTRFRRRGPGVPFGLGMYQLTGVPQGLIACAHGGASMEQWSPAGKSSGGGSLYGAMLRRFCKNGSKVKGMIWYQGCSEAVSDSSEVYSRRMKAFIKAVRRDFNSPMLPIVMVQIARHHSRFSCGPVSWNEVRNQQRLLGETVDNCVTVPTLDLELDDAIHLSGESQIRLGKRLVRAAGALLKIDKAGKLPIRLKDVRFKTDPRSGCLDIAVRFSNVAGKLVSQGRAAGFAVSDGRGNILNMIYKTELHGSRVLLKTNNMRSEIEGMYLHYGMGTTAYCNITDQKDRSLPGFTVWPTGRPRIVTPFVQELLVSRVVECPGSIKKVKRPVLEDKSLQWRSARFGSINLSRRKEVGPKAGAVAVHYLFRVFCPEQMQLAVCLGYDGPVKVWFGRTLIYQDSDGVQLPEIDQVAAVHNARKGMHDVTVSLGLTPESMGALFVRLERLDVRSRDLMCIARDYVLPEVVKIIPGE